MSTTIFEGNEGLLTDEGLALETPLGFESLYGGQFTRGGGGGARPIFGYRCAAEGLRP